MKHVKGVCVCVCVMKEKKKREVVNDKKSLNG